MKELTTTNGYKFIVDDDWADDVGSVKWHAIGKTRKYIQTQYKHTDGHMQHVLLHRLIVGALAGEVVDHINNDPLDNRRENLRACTQQENLFNRKFSGYKSKFKGVEHRTKNSWRARLKRDGKDIVIGHFKTEIEAAIAYNKKAKEMFGEFAYLNDI